MSARAATHARPGTGVASMRTPPARAIADAPTTLGRPAMTHAHFGQVAVSLQRAGRLESDAALETAADRVATHETGLHRAAPAQPRDQRLAERAAPMAANQVRGWSGRPLDASVRTGIEARLGGDFGRVRLHTDRAAARTAAALSARAFTVGEHVVFGEGQYAPGTATGRALLAHELAHTAQQRATGAQVVQRDVADDVIDKLSYGLFDWAITDRESIDALALLGTLPDPDLARTLAKMGNKFVDRLLDNLPDAAKTGEVYQRVIRALGVAGTMSYAKEQLDFGVFDWAITDAEVARVFNVFTTLPAAEQENFLAGLDSAKRLGRLLRNSGIGHFTLYIVPWMRTLTRGRLTERQRAIMRTIAEESPDTPIDVLQQATEIRYDVVVGPTQMSGRTPSPWSAGKLRETYLALDHLPDAHVARNKELLRFGQFTKDQTASADGSSVAIVAGTYSQSDRELAVNIKDAEVPQAQGSTAQATAPKTDLKQTLIHETGHAVDAEMGWSAGAEPAKPERGGWKSFATHTDAATEMVDSANGPIKTALDATQRGEVVDDMANAMGRGSVAALKSDIGKRPWFTGLPKTTQANVLGDKSLDALRIGLGTNADAPWFAHAEGGEKLGTRIYQQSYAPDWVSYLHAARARMVEVPKGTARKYQFRDAGEWFAECYAAYYMPDERGKGALLADKDANTKQYFDASVDTRAASR